MTNRCPIHLALLTATALAGCAAELPPVAFSAGTPELRPEAFFAGHTRSTGVFENQSGAPVRRFRVEGFGQAQPDGTFQLDQKVTTEPGDEQKRTWVMRQIDPHHYSASLTDASGPVEAEAYGDLFHLRYAMKTPIGGQMEQWLYLQPDGRTVVNEATVRVFGIVVARLSERITHEDR